MENIYWRLSANSKIGVIAKIALPIFIGGVVIWWLFNDEFNLQTFQLLRFDARMIITLLLALLCVFGRDFGMSWRFRALTDCDLSWRQSVKVTMLCEFTSALTPSSVGGGALSMIFLNREGINFGRATTLTMTTLLLDELFFVVSSPLIFLFVPYDQLFGFGDDNFTSGLKIAFWIIYVVIFIWTIILYLGVISHPQIIRRVLIGLFSWRLLRRWKNKITEMSDNMVATSVELRTRNRRWWINSFVATSVSWISRYLLVNALFWGLYPAADQLVVFGRQFIVWAILMVSPTPGGSGISEYLFTSYYGDMIVGGGFVMLLALLWRLLSYYIYLLIGIFVLPSFLAAKKVKNQIM